MTITAKFLLTFVFFASFATETALCSPPESNANQQSPSLAWRIEVAFRDHANLPPGAQVHVGLPAPSNFAGYTQVEVTYTTQGQTSKPLIFLVSLDGKKIVQLHEIPLDTHPRTLVSQQDRPARGGPQAAPVLIVGFDDLECPFCAYLNETLLPAILGKYKDQVRIVYRDYPSEGHPWALRAAIDSNCLASQNPTAYWQAVDQIHLQAGTIDSQSRSVQNASHTIDSLIRQVAQRNELDLKSLNACVEKQDPTEVNASLRYGRSLGVERTPTLFINGAKIEGAVPLPFLFQIIDKALLAQGIVPK